MIYANEIYLKVIIIFKLRISNNKGKNYQLFTLKCINQLIEIEN